MKVMFNLGTMGKGGAERVVANLSNSFIKMYDVSIVANPVSVPQYKLNKKIHLFSLDGKNKSNNIIIRTFKRILKLYKIIKEEKPDIVIAFLPTPSIRLMIVRLFLNCKTIISVRNDPKIEYNNFLKKLFVELLYLRADGLIFQTKEAMNFFSKLIQKKSVVIPNPINERFIMPEYKGIRKKEIVTVGRLVAQKNHFMLIKAFSIVYEKHPEYVLKIYGEGPLKKDLKIEIDNYNLSNNVFLMGEIDNIENEIYKSSIFVLSSNYEGMPNALMEAMTIGLPCISTDCPCGGPHFLINDNVNGTLVKVGDYKELANKINYLIENYDIAINYGKNAQKISTSLSPAKIIKMWEDYIKSIVCK